MNLPHNISAWRRDRCMYPNFPAFRVLRLLRDIHSIPAAGTTIIQEVTHRVRRWKTCATNGSQLSVPGLLQCNVFRISPKPVRRCTCANAPHHRLISGITTPSTPTGLRRSLPLAGSNDGWRISPPIKPVSRWKKIWYRTVGRSSANEYAKKLMNSRPRT